VLLYSGSRHVTGIYYLKKGYAYVLNQEFEKGITIYKKAVLYISNNNKFLFYYGSALYLNKNFKESIPFLEKATSQSSMPNAFIILGNSLKELKRYKASEEAYLTAANSTPSKLYPRYLLVKLFEESGQQEKAVKIAKEILNSKEKVKTTAGTEIKNEMKILIDQYNNEMFNL
jgi:O-antigen polymerase